MITESRSIYFRHVISKDGSIAAESRFKIKSSAASPSAARADAEAWAGNIGDPLKIGDGHNSWLEDNNFVISARDICQLDNEFFFDIKLNGVIPNDNWTLLPGSERIESAGSIIEKKVFSCCSANIPPYPHEGEITVNDDGSRMICTSSTVTDLGSNCRKLSVVLKNFQELPLPEAPVPLTDTFTDEFRNKAHLRKAKFYWSSEIYGSKIAELKFFDENYRPDWLDEDYILIQMETSCDGEYGYIVELTAQKITTSLVSSEIRNADGKRTAVAIYQVKNSDKDNFSNLVGTVPNFISGDFIITQTTEKLINPALWEIGVNAAERKGELPLGNITSECDKNGIVSKKMTVFVSSNEADAFRSELLTGSVAAWAGDNFYLESFNEKDTVDGKTFELHAREIYTRMLSLEKKEKFSGFTIDGTPCRKIIYNSLWQVRPDDISSFAELSGSSASWSNDDTIITEITPKQQSAMEYYISVEAQRRSNPELHTIYNSENYENLANRTDLQCELTEFRLSPKDCGYFIDSDGLYDLIPGWLPGTECPLLTSAALHPRYINAVLKILRISETTYHKGSMNKNTSEMINWIASRVINGKIGGINGSFLKTDLSAKEIYDSHGVRWTKITKVYDLAPANEHWSPYHFQQF